MEFPNLKFIRSVKIFKWSRKSLFFKVKRLYRKYCKYKFEIFASSLSSLLLFFYLVNKTSIQQFDYNYIVKIQTLRRLSFFASELFSDVHVKTSLGRTLERSINNGIIVNELKSLVKNFSNSTFIDGLLVTIVSLKNLVFYKEVDLERHLLKVFEQVFTNENTLSVMIDLGKDACLDYESTYNSLIKALVDCSLYTLSSKVSIRGYLFFVSTLYEEYKSKQKGFSHRLDRI